jgi:cation diffusion facilitator CzcD-associated flavoprotein CzcO
MASGILANASTASGASATAPAATRRSGAKSAITTLRQKETTRALHRLENRVKEDLAAVGYPVRPWPRALDKVAEVAIVGGGQAGLGISFALAREGISSVIVDGSPAGHEGPWRTFARMHHLQTTKLMSGIDGGLPSLAPSSWYQARFGSRRWKSIDNIETDAWAEYLSWFRRVLDINVLNCQEVGPIEWRETDRSFVLPLTPTCATTRSVGDMRARRVVLATGLTGSGARQVPGIVSENVDPRAFAHCYDVVDFDRVKGRRVAVLGSAASAFDNALIALRRGATTVDMFCRRSMLPSVNPYRWTEFSGFLKHHADLPDNLKWAFGRELVRAGQAVPSEVAEAVKEWPNFTLHLGTQWRDVVHTDELVHVRTATGQSMTFEYILIATGHDVDLRKRPELVNLADHVALWRDRFQDTEGDDALGRFPYLGSGFEFLERSPGAAPWINRVFNFTFASLLSTGLGGGSISGLKYGIRRLVDAITRQVYVERAPMLLDDLRELSMSNLPTLQASGRSTLPDEAMELTMQETI